MRVLITTDTIGGVWTFTQQLATDLLGAGHQVALVSLGRMPSHSQREWCDRAAASWGASFVYSPSDAPLEWMQGNEHAYTAALPTLHSAFNSFDPEVMLTSQYCFGRLPVSIPKIIVAHSDVLSWSQACGKSPLQPSPWLDTYVRLVAEGLENADALVAPTHWMLAALEEHFSLPQHAVVILNGRSLDPRPAAAPKKVQAVTAGRFWDEAKNLSILDQFESPLPVLVAGSYALASHTTSVNSPSVTLLGELSESQVLSLFRESSIYICTSIYEPFGLAPLEAALCDCAVVANDIPSLREIWADCASFYNDPTSLKATLHTLTNPDTLSSARIRSGQRARNFTSSRMTEGYLKLLERLLQSSHAKRSAHAA